MISGAGYAPGVPTVDPGDPHRFAMNGQFWYPAGYYPAIAALTADQTDYVNYYKNLINKQSANRINYFRNVLTMGQPCGNSIVPYLRTGPGNANDGRPKFDLRPGSPRFDEPFFDYWRTVITYAQSKGVVVQLCIFDTWHNKAWITESGGDIQHEWGMKYDFYNGANNINGINTANSTDWTNPSHPVFQIQKLLIEQVVRKLGDLPNIVYEISNENYYNANWELQLADHLSAYEASRGLARHLVMPRDLPNHDNAGGKRNDPATTHNEMVGKHGVNKPLVADNDGGGDADVTGRRRKAWAVLTADGHVNYFHFSMYQKAVLDSQDVSDGMRYVGYTRKFVEDLAVDLRGMQPSDSLVSNGWCYAKSGERYVLYLMNGGSTTIWGLPGSYSAKWFNPRDGSNQPASGGPAFTTPDGNDWVLYIVKTAESQPGRPGRRPGRGSG